MRTYLGVDLGTSSIKLLLVDAKGNILQEASSPYDVSSPFPLWNEQDPTLWIKGLKAALNNIKKNNDISLIKAISFGGQMHGLVTLDKDDNIIRPCILWNDGRSEKEVKYLNEEIGKTKLTALTGNIAFAGFTAPKILWMKNNEPDNFKKIAKIMLPKDYLAYYLTGKNVSDYSDASGMLLLDVKNKCYSQEMLKILSINENQLPKLQESNEIISRIKENVANELGLSNDVDIVIGGGDNAIAAIGTGTINDGDTNISLGTSGTLFIASDNYIEDKQNALHSFCHANGKYHLMGCILTASSARKWWLEEILKTNDYNLDEEFMSQSFNKDLYFLPYLNGERSPHNDVNARGAFIGLTSQTTRGEMSRTIIEGVSFAIKDCLEIAKKDGINPSFSNLCGGGAKSKLWRQVMADILNIDIHILQTEQGPSLGAAILCLVAEKEYSSLNDAVDAIVKVKEIIKPNPGMVKKYEEKYKVFHQLYPLLKQIY